MRDRGGVRVRFGVRIWDPLLTYNTIFGSDKDPRSNPNSNPYLYPNRTGMTLCQRHLSIWLVRSFILADLPVVLKLFMYYRRTIVVSYIVLIYVIACG